MVVIMAVTAKYALIEHQNTTDKVLKASLVNFINAFNTSIRKQTKSNIIYIVINE